MKILGYFFKEVSKMQPDGATGYLKSVDGVKSVLLCVGACASHSNCSVVMFSGSGNCSLYERQIVMSVKTINNLKVYIKGKLNNEFIYYNPQPTVYLNPTFT